MTHAHAGYHRVMPAVFLQTIAKVPSNGQTMLTHYALPETKGIRFYLSKDHSSGFGIINHELVNLFSLVKGKGKRALHAAIAKGADHLNCFDTWLVSFYSKHGFVEVKREANWTAGQPDVIYMQLDADKATQVA